MEQQSYNLIPGALVLPHHQLLGGSYQLGIPLPRYEVDGAVASSARLGEGAEERGSAFITSPHLDGDSPLDQRHI